MKVTLLTVLAVTTLMTASSAFADRAERVSRGQNPQKIYNAHHNMPKAHEFPAEVNGYPQMGFNQYHKDRHIRHTFKVRGYRGCKVKSGKLVLHLKATGTQVETDGIIFVENGAPIGYRPATSVRKWPMSKANGTKRAVIRLKQNELNSLYDRDFSFYVQDDTAVKSAKLVVNAKCDRSTRKHRGQRPSRVQRIRYRN